MPSRLAAAVAAKATTWWTTRKPTREAIVVVALLALIFQAAYLASYYVRSELLFKTSDADIILRTILLVVGVKLVVFYSRGLCHRPWRAARFADLNRLLRAATLCLLVFIAVNHFGSYASGWVPIPRSVLLLDWVFTLLGVGGMQAIARSIYEEIVPVTSAGNQKTVLVIDASPAGREVARALESMRSAGYHVAGLLDDDPALYATDVGRARVLGGIDSAATCAHRLRAAEIVVCSGRLFGARLRALCDACAALGVRVMIAERAQPDDAAGSRHWGAALPVIRDVELRDLLSRPEARLDNQDERVLPFIRGKVVLVTGAGGSIGSEICRQLLRFEPERLVLVERSECGLFSIHRELADLPEAADIELVPVLCDITHAERVDRMFAEHRPRIVIHAAAYKHVPLMESHPVEAIENNTLATATLAEIADAHRVEAFVALSTDKAVHPSSVMGASKLVAERFLQAFGATSATRFVAVRFGNVIGSSGSAVPIFEAQLRNRRPITVTDERVRRYFMTITEAAQLVLLAGALPGRGGACVLEMGESIPIVELVSSIAFVMRVPPGQVRIRFCGLRPGEKIDEELFYEDERRDATSHPLVIRVSRPARPLEEVRQWLGELKSAAAGPSDAAFHAIMDIVAADCAGLVPVAEPPEAAAPHEAAPQPLAEQRA
ncbi:MAG: polysaccharide biosynthesis protein [Planctomycetaceae bacterium]